MFKDQLDAFMGFLLAGLIVVSLGFALKYRFGNSNGDA